jgi:uncharacterized membrane protein
MTDGSAPPPTSKPTFGRILFALAIACLGAQQIARSDFVPGPLIAPAWVGGRTFWADLSGLVLIAGSLLLVSRRFRTGAVVLAACFFLCVLVFHLPAPWPIVVDGIARTRAFEALTLGAVALLLMSPQFAAIGRIVFGLAMVVFGIQHFLYTAAVAAVIPAWIPARTLWAYFTGTAFIAVGLAILTRIQAWLAAVLLGVMFLSWFVVLHVPLVARHLHEPNQWNSLFVVVAMAGGSWMVAEAQGRDIGAR